MTISIKLLDNAASIEKKINTGIAQYINDKISNNLNNIARGIRSLIPKWINAQPEIQALLSNELVGQFGITISPQAIVDAVINSVVSSTSISFTKFNNKLQGGGLEINVQPDDFSNLLGLPEGHTVYFGGDLHWLDWMLLRGDTIIVVGYEYNPQTGLGRTKLGNMVKGRGFRVPPQYSGTIDNNFITRSLNGISQSKDITNLFDKTLDQ